MMRESAQMWTRQLGTILAKWTVEGRKSVSGRLLTGASWSVVATVFAQGVALVTSMFLARLLGKHEYGQFSLIQNAVNSFSLFGSFGIGLAATKYISEFWKKDGEKTGSIVGLSLFITNVFAAIAAAALYLLAPWIAVRLMEAPALAVELRFAALALFFAILTNTQIGVLAGFEAFKLIAKLNYIRALVYLPAMVGAVAFWGLRGAIAAMALAGAAGWSINYRAIIRLCANNGTQPFCNGRRTEYAMLLRFSLPAVLTCALPGTSIWLANSILARQPDGYSQVAFLSAAYQLRNALLLIPTTIGNASTPLMSCLNAARDTPGLRRAFRTAIGMSVVCTFLGIVPMLVFSRHLMGLFGPDFSGKEVVLNIMVLGAGMLAIQLPIGNLIVGIGNMWVGLIINLLWAAVLLTSTWVLVGQGRGATGAAIAQLVAYGFHLISNGSYAVRLLSRSRAAVPLTVE